MSVQLEDSGPGWELLVRGLGPLPVLPSSLSGDSHKEVLQGLGTHVYFMNDFRERGKKIIQEAVFFLLCFVGKQKKLPHLILTLVLWDFSD